MKNYKDSDYALNRYSAGIVYKFADGTTHAVTLKDYLADNPDKSESDFAELKALSDSMYLSEDRTDYRQTWKNVPIHSLEKTDACYIPSVEFSVIEAPEQAGHEKQRRELMKLALDKLTETQRRRYIQYHIGGLSTWQIAEMESTNQKSVYESIQAAEKKIRKILASG